MYYLTGCMKCIRLLITVDLPQVGAARSHVPFCVQVKTGLPISEDPTTQLYTACVTVPSLVTFTVPLLGEEVDSQVTVK